MTIKDANRFYANGDYLNALYLYYDSLGSCTSPTLKGELQKNIKITMSFP